MLTALAEGSAAAVYPGQTTAEREPAVRIQEGRAQSTAGTAALDDLARDVYCILGVPIDAVELAEAVRRINTAAANAAPFLISTVNVNFLISAAANTEFREAIFLSELCSADGMPIIWIARLLGLPIKQRVAGSDMFDALRAAQGRMRPLSVFLFGGAKGVAAAAADILDNKPGGVRCVGSLYPGYGTIDDLSRDEIIEAINDSRADMLVIALGASKGQAWLLRNRRRLKTPVRTHFGAVLNFAAGTVRRAPAWLGRLGLEWLWRIKEEPHLWRRYAHDGLILLRMLMTRILPLAVSARWQQVWAAKPKELRIDESDEDTGLTLCLSGDATAGFVSQAISRFRHALVRQQHLTVDLSSVRRIDARFFGLLLMLRKRLNSSNAHLKFIGVGPRIARSFRHHGVEFLLSD